MENDSFESAADLAWVGDERLIASLRTNYFELLLREMVRRYYAVLCILIGKRASFYGLHKEEAEDAQDIVVPVLEYALQHFLDGQDAPHKQASFRSYLKRILHWRLIDFVQGLRQRRQRFRSFLEQDWLSYQQRGSIRRVIGSPDWTDPAESDPALLAERKDSQARMQASVKELGGVAPRIFEGGAREFLCACWPALRTVPTAQSCAGGRGSARN